MQMLKYVDIFILRFSILAPFTFWDMRKLKIKKGAKMFAYEYEKHKILPLFKKT